MKHMIQGRFNALHVVCGSLFLVCALTHPLFADTLSQAIPSQFTEDYRSYVAGVVMVRFNPESLQHRDSLSGPWSLQARILQSAADIIPGITLRHDLCHALDGLVSLALPHGVGVQEAIHALNQCDDVLFAEPSYKYRLAGIL